MRLSFIAILPTITLSTACWTRWTRWARSPTTLTTPKLQSSSSSSSNTTDPSQCDCYLISGPEPGYFTHYKLWDFRNTAHIPRQPQPAPPLGQTNDDLDTEILEATTNLFSQTPFSKDWHVQTWHRAADPLLSPIPMTNSESNVFLMKAPRSSPPGQNASQANTFLTFRTTRFSNHATTAEIESRLGLIDHCSLRLRMRLMSRETALYRPYTDISDPNPSIVLPPPQRPFPTVPQKPQPQRVPSGTCAGIFTYRSATCESDIEILTADWPYTIHYANQPDYDPITDKIIPNASAVVNLTRPWTEWTTHRLDWQPRSTRWYADGALQAVKTYRVPDRPSLIVLNLWTNGGSWTGDLRVGESVYLGIEWMELVYNLSSSSSLGSPPSRSSSSSSLSSLSLVGEEEGGGKVQLQQGQQQQQKDEDEPRRKQLMDGGREGEVDGHGHHLDRPDLDLSAMGESRDRLDRLRYHQDHGPDKRAIGSTTPSPGCRRPCWVDR